MNKIKFYKYFKIIVVLTSFIFLYINSKENYENILNNLNLDYQIIFFSILIIMIIQNFLNIRIAKPLKC